MNPNSGKDKPSERWRGSKRPLKARRDPVEQPERVDRVERARAEPEDNEPDIIPTSSFTAERPSRASVETMIIRTNAGKAPKPVFLTALVGMLGLFGLIALNGPQLSYAYGYALLLSGLFCLFRPPQSAYSKGVDFAAVALLLVLSASFLPQFYWPDAAWRAGIVETSVIDLPSMLSIRPLASFEIWVQVAAGLVWFYVISAWPMNQTGRNWFYFSFCILLSILSIVVLWGLLVGGDFIGSFHFIQNQDFNISLMSSGAVLSFVFLMGNLHGRNLSPFIGLLGTGLPLAVLYTIGSGLGILFCVFGVGLWYVYSLRFDEFPRRLKQVVPFVLVGVVGLVFIDGNLEVLSEKEPSSGGSSSSLRMLMDAPLTGVGLGNFEEVLPQYEKVRDGEERFSHALNDVVLFATENGLLSMVAALVLFASYLLLFRTKDSMAGRMREPVRIALIVFAVNMLIGKPVHNLGAGYYGLFLMALALPRRPDLSGIKVPPVLWRGFGGLLSVCGFIWIIAAVFRVPILTEVARVKYAAEVSSAIEDGATSQAIRTLEKWTALSPLDGEAYFLKGSLLLTQNDREDEAADSFAKARASDPHNGWVALREGVLWAEHDIDQAIDAWAVALTYAFDDEALAIHEIIQASRGKPRLLRRLPDLLAASPSYRGALLAQLEGRLMLREMDQQLRADPELAEFSRDLRTGVVLNWLEQGGSEKAAGFLDRFSDRIDFEWWARAIIEKDRADFDSSMEWIRQNLESPDLPGAGIEIDNVFIEQREFDISRSDLVKGGALMQVYLEAGEFSKALRIAEDLLASPRGTPALLYWKAECLFQLGDVIESWFTFQQYIEQNIIP